MEPIRLCIADTMRAWVSSLAVLNGRLENMVKIFSDLELEFRKVVRPKIIPLVDEKKKKKKVGDSKVDVIVSLSSDFKSTGLIELRTIPESPDQCS